MTIQQLIYFKEISSTLNFTKAAERLFVSQSSLSYAIGSLERELGAPLFTRQKGQKLILTNYGTEFLPYAESILQNIDKSREHIKQMCDPLSGVVRVAYGYINGVPIVSQMFKQYYKDNPERDISIQFQINDGTKVIEHAMLNGETDLAFIASPSSGELNCTPVATQELVVVLPKGHPLGKKAALTVKDIKSEHLLAYHPGGNLVGRISEIFTDSGYTPNFADFLSGWTEEVAHISMGRGIGILPRIPLNEDEVEVIPLDHPKRLRSIFLYWPKQPALSPAAEYVRQYCIAYFNRLKA